MPQNSQISRAAAIVMGGGPVFWKQGTENAIAPRPRAAEIHRMPQIFHIQLRFMLVRKRNPVFLSSWLSCTNSIRRFKEIVQYRSSLNRTEHDPETPKPKVKLKHPIDFKNMERGHSHSIGWVG
jgi:hypothetical protein